jgi:hypothetical protein
MLLLLLHDLLHLWSIVIDRVEIILEYADQWIGLVKMFSLVEVWQPLLDQCKRSLPRVPFEAIVLLEDALSDSNRLLRRQVSLRWLLGDRKRRNH